MDNSVIAIIAFLYFYRNRIEKITYFQNFITIYVSFLFFSNIIFNGIVK